jgi:hypothetical protein
MLEDLNVHVSRFLHDSNVPMIPLLCVASMHLGSKRRGAILSCWLSGVDWCEPVWTCETSAGARLQCEHVKRYAGAGHHVGANLPYDVQTCPMLVPGTHVQALAALIKNSASCSPNLFCWEWKKFTQLWLHVRRWLGVLNKIRYQNYLHDHGKNCETNLMTHLTAYD